MSECVSPCSLAAEKGTYSKTFWWLDSGVPHLLVSPAVSGSVAMLDVLVHLERSRPRQVLFPATS